MKARTPVKSTYILLILLAIQTYAICQRFDKTILLEGKKREFIVSRPTGGIPAGGYPVVFMLHGTSGDGEKFYVESGWKELGQQEKFVSVFPSSLAYCVTEDGKNTVTTKWNNGDLQSVICPGQVLKDDVLFIKSIVDSLKASLPVNNNRIYVCGFSNGGGMASKLAVVMSEVFAATVNAEASLHQLDSGEIKPRIPCWLTVGTLDERFTSAFQIPVLPYNDSSLIYLNGLIANFTGSMGLQNKYSKKDSLTNLTFYEYNKDLNGKTTENKFVLMLAKNMYHVFPNGTNYPHFESAPLYWNLFFKNIIKSNSTPIATLTNISSMNIHPNPAHNRIFIEKSWKVTHEKYFITNTQGQVIQYGIINKDHNEIPISELSTGIYLLRISGQTEKLIKL